MNKVFPPGAAQQSMIVSPGCGSTTDTTNPAFNGWSINAEKGKKKKIYPQLHMAEELIEKYTGSPLEYRAKVMQFNSEYLRDDLWSHLN